MEHIVQVPDYRPGGGIQLSWDEDFEIAVSVSGSEVSIKANREGLVSLARHLLTLAQDQVHGGAHIHLTADQEIDSDHDLILERA
ncbi:Imm32 family immunity protein [Streptomyces sp. NPDC004393]